MDGIMWLSFESSTLHLLKKNIGDLMNKIFLNGINKTTSITDYFMEIFITIKVHLEFSWKQSENSSLEEKHHSTKPEKAVYAIFALKRNNQWTGHFRRDLYTV